MTSPLPRGGIELPPDVLQARWTRSWTPPVVAERLTGITAPWCVVGGWALDLFRGGQTRAHDDIEIAIPAAGFDEVRPRFPGCAFDAVGSGLIWPDATPDQLAAVHQTWLRDPATDDYLVDVFREPHDGDTWICRHDDRIRFSYAEIIRHSPDGIPYLAPQLVLLFKSKHVRPKDQADFDATVPYLTSTQRTALADLITLAHPGHRWLAAL